MSVLNHVFYNLQELFIEKGVNDMNNKTLIIMRQFISFTEKNFKFLKNLVENLKNFQHI